MSDTDPTIKILRVAGGTPVDKLAASIAGVAERGQIPGIEYIGAGAGNQAIKAIVVANGLLAQHGMTMSIVPRFVDRTIEGRDVAAIQLIGKVTSL